ncbi:MAG: hypothetical protein AB1758_18165, partial [Candidatus Eremiobacterota bacterium]
SNMAELAGAAAAERKTALGIHLFASAPEGVRKELLNEKELGRIQERARRTGEDENQLVYERLLELKSEKPWLMDGNYRKTIDEYGAARRVEDKALDLKEALGKGGGPAPGTEAESMEEHDRRNAAAIAANLGMRLA